MSSADRAGHAPLREGEEPPPPGVKGMAAVRWGILLAMVVVAFLSFWFLLAPKPRSSTRYTCPMVEHAFVVQDDPGECPICHMRLMPMDAELAEARRHGDGTPALDAGPPVPGVVPVTLELDRVQRVGIRTAKVEETSSAAGLRAPAYVAAPEQGESQVHVRAPGFVEKIGVSQTGVTVGAGQPLFHMYSPEIYRAEEELLTARRFHDADAGGVLGGGPTVDAARKRLELLGMTARDIDDVLAKNAAERLVAVRAPAGGFVVKKGVALGAYVTPEMTLYEIVDLARVYVVVELFAGDLATVAPGSVAEVTFPGLAPLEAKVDLVYPEVSQATRTTRVRLRIKNEKRALRPGMYGEALFRGVTSRALSIPRDALIDTGNARYVFVDLGEGKFAPRAVVVAAASGDRLTVLDGLRAGEIVVSGATFLLDAESRLESSFVAAAPSASAPAPAPAPAGSAR
jgi:Cu(I)/Ag(I) efflux system membrane fusion protein